MNEQQPTRRGTASARTPSPSELSVETALQRYVATLVRNYSGRPSRHDPDGRFSLGVLHSAGKIWRATNVYDDPARLRAWLQAWTRRTLQVDVLDDDSYTIGTLTVASDVYLWLTQTPDFSRCGDVLAALDTVVDHASGRHHHRQDAA
ncbi:hypothetical protein [Cellulosimicrobium composti]|uniref:hypothetical protein n=1 Tax=Cellulosimicrobium composti TaxID=2672572 RepID=UPI0037B970D8